MNTKGQPKPDVELIGNDVLVRLPKGILILSKQDYLKAWRRGKAWRRAEAMKARLANQEA